MFFKYTLKRGHGDCDETASPRNPREWLRDTPPCLLLYIPKICSSLKISLQPSHFPGRLGPMILPTFRSNLFVPFAGSDQQLSNICCYASLRFKPSVMLRCVITDVSKDPSSFIFGTKQDVSVLCSYITKAYAK